MSRAQEIGLVLSLLLAGGLSWWLMLRPAVGTDASSLDALPKELNGWRSVDVAMDSEVTDMLGADYHIQRTYQHRQRLVTFVYLGYYGSQSGGTPEHTPEVCYPAQGWVIRQSLIRRIGGRDGFDVRELLVEKEGEQRLVHFWYRTARATGLTSTAQLRLQHFWGRLTRDEGDGALIRLSTPVRGGEVGAERQRLESMDLLIERMMHEIWPAPGSPLARVGGRAGAQRSDSGRHDWPIRRRWVSRVSRAMSRPAGHAPSQGVPLHARHGFASASSLAYSRAAIFGSP